ncbi:hypothetical protein QYE76_044906 [Lolium multiflorum]|uniref:Reverse transcriptase zinc-binding domain-containing protein n=1 Tax=Lolium multiflorum TaxID=4521 RepID=A0AAD8TLI6_LOLMU|nr:hypothetical protein QYE76_044906 [Lolium multiflorum]
MRGWRCGVDVGLLIASPAMVYQLVICPLCGVSDEIIDHISLLCPYTVHVWAGVDVALDYHLHTLVLGLSEWWSDAVAVLRGEKHIQSSIATVVFLDSIFKRDHRINLARPVFDATMAPNGSTDLHAYIILHPSSILCSTMPPRISANNMIQLQLRRTILVIQRNNEIVLAICLQSVRVKRSITNVLGIPTTRFPNRIAGICEISLAKEIASDLTV